MDCITFYSAPSVLEVLKVIRVGKLVEAKDMQFNLNGTFNGGDPSSHFFHERKNVFTVLL